MTVHKGCTALHCLVQGESEAREQSKGEEENVEHSSVSCCLTGHDRIRQDRIGLYHIISYHITWALGRQYSTEQLGCMTARPCYGLYCFNDFMSLSLAETGG